MRIHRIPHTVRPVLHLPHPIDTIEKSESVDLTNQLPKLGIRNLSPHLRNSAILRTTKTIAELWIKKSCGTVIADLENLTSAIPQLSAVSCQSATFLSLFLSSG
jgi:hypothetical protein